MSVINIESILQILPHRYPILLVDRVESIEIGQSISAIKNISFNEPVFQGHFPGHPVFPGVLQIEAMAQTMAILAVETDKDRHDGKKQDALFYLAGVDNVRFKRIVTPGDRCDIHVQIIKQKQSIWKAEAKVQVAGELAAKADLLAYYQKGELGD